VLIELRIENLLLIDRAELRPGAGLSSARSMSSRFSMRSSISTVSV